MAETQKKKLTVRDVVTVATMMVIYYFLCMIPAQLTLAVPVLNIYFCAGIQGFICASFYLIAANRVNKHGLLLIWATVMGAINALMGFVFLLPYFIAVGAVAELTMIGKDTYRKPLRNGIGWMVYGIGMVIGNAIPIWLAWESYTSAASASGFQQDLIAMQIDFVSNPLLILLACAITAGLSMLGILFGQRLLRRHFQKAGVI